MAKLWTGDEWRALSETEERYRRDNGFLVLEDDDPRTAVNEAPGLAMFHVRKGETVTIQTPEQAAPAPEAPKKKR